jgi:hypothetical protein
MTDTTEEKALVRAQARQLDFETRQREAKALAMAKVMPKDLRGDVATAMVLMDLSKRSGLPIMALANGINFIQGRMGFSGQFYKSVLNQSGYFGPAVYVWDEDPSGKPIGVTMSAKDLRTGAMCKARVDEEMVKAEGWDKDKGQGSNRQKSKWVTMPMIMYMHRVHAFFVRMYCPELVFGLQTTEELLDVAKEDRPPATFTESLKQKADNDQPAQGPQPVTFGEGADPYPDRRKAEEEKQAAANWWVEEKHYKFRKARDFIIAVMVGFAVPFESFSVKVGTGEEKFEDYTEFKAFTIKNPLAVGSLANAPDEVKTAVRQKFIFTMKIDPAKWREFSGGDQ